jgi:hypothetical protein
VPKRTRAQKLAAEADMKMLSVGRPKYVYSCTTCLKNTPVAGESGCILRSDLISSREGLPTDYCIYKEEVLAAHIVVLREALRQKS